MQISPAELLELFNLIEKQKTTKGTIDPKKTKPVITTLANSGHTTSNLSSQKPSQKHSHPDKGSRADTFENILSILREKYGERTFGTGEALKLIKNKLDRKRSTVGDAIRYGRSKRMVFILGKGKYSFLEPQKKARIDSENLIVNLLTNNSISLKSMAAIIAKLRHYTTFHITRDGLSARFMDADQTSLLNFDMKKEYFDTYECSSNVKLTVDCQELLRVISLVSKSHMVRLTLEQGQAEERGYYQLSDLDNTHKLAYSKCSITDSALVHTLPLPPSDKAICQFRINRAVFEEILRNAKTESNRLILHCGRESITFESQAKQYSKALYDDKHTLTFLKASGQSNEVTAVYDIERLLPIVTTSSLVNELNISILEEDVLIVDMPFGASVDLQYMLMPIKAQASTPEPVPT